MTGNSVARHWQRRISTGPLSTPGFTTKPSLAEQDRSPGVRSACRTTTQGQPAPTTHTAVTLTTQYRGTVTQTQEICRRFNEQTAAVQVPSCLHPVPQQSCYSGLPLTGLTAPNRQKPLAASGTGTGRSYSTSTSILRHSSCHSSKDTTTADVTVLFTCISSTPSITLLSYNITNHRYMRVGPDREMTELERE